MPFVYFIHEDGNLTMFKIGKTENHPADRMEQLQTGNPRKLKIYRWLRVDNHSIIEEYLHARFADVHIRGEWFHTTADLIDEECTLVVENNPNAGVSGQWEHYTDQDRMDVKIRRMEVGKYRGKKTPQKAAEDKNAYMERVMEKKIINKLT